MPAVQVKPSVQALLGQLKGWREWVAPGSHQVLHALEQCRTALLGYHVYRCTGSECGQVHYQYHSCRNRHCPHCGSTKKEEWIESRLRELLPVKYYHVVFTLPHQLNSLVMGNRRELFNLLFEAATYTLLTFGRDGQYLGAQVGILSVLHTWGQQLCFHPHVHCIVSGGGMDSKGKWKEALKVKHGILFPVKALRVVYRTYFLQHLQKLLDAGKVKLSEQQAREWPHLRSELYNQQWIVYAKQPFGGPQQVVEYLGRYTHKVAICNHRIQAIDAQGNVTFQYKDYSDGSKKKWMTLEGKEFLRRFEQHILPKGFVKIRSYGYLGNYQRKQRVNQLLNTMNKPQHAEVVNVPVAVRMLEKYGKDITLCPCCQKAKLELLYVRQAKTAHRQVLKE
ncbi:MAG: IS91 family transposase [Bacteroidota bacterium]|nr:IS91 family transposase [Bacteroidota bacterium]